MIHSLESFRYKGTPIQVLGDYTNPKFIAKEICNALNISNHRDALTRLDDDEKGVVISDTLGGKQEVLVINEPGLYSLVLRSTKPEAKAFKRWITHEVLPAIRKQGFYGIPAAVERKVKIELAKERLSTYIARSSIWNPDTVERFMAIHPHLTNKELGKVFECSDYSVTHLKMLLRHASGDFTDHRPKAFKPEPAPQLALVEELARQPADEDINESIWRMRARGKLTFKEIADKTGYSKERVRKVFHKHELHKEGNHVN